MQTFVCIHILSYEIMVKDICFFFPPQSTLTSMLACDTQWLSDADIHAAYSMW